MSNYIEYKDKIAFHPGYYIEEIVEESGLTLAELSKRLNTTPQNLNILIQGKKNLSIDMAGKLSEMLGTTVEYWVTLQKLYDKMQAEFFSDIDLEKEVFKVLDYKYFRHYFGLPNLPRKIGRQIKYVRDFLEVPSLAILKEKDLAVNFRSYSKKLSMSNIVNANAMVQIAINLALKIDSPQFDKKKFEESVEFALTQTRNHQEFLPIIKEAFLELGVILIVFPNLKDSGTNGATKMIDGRVLLMVNDRRHFADTFWFKLPTGNGFADMVFLPKRTSLNPALVVELKWDKTAEGAISQIKSKGYVSVLKEYKGNILLVGINYEKKSRKHQCRIEKFEM